MHTRTHAHMHTRTHAHTHTCTHTRAHAHMHTRIHAHMHTRTHAHMHAHTHTCTHAHTHTCTRARMHVNAHARTLARAHWHSQDVRARAHSPAGWRSSPGRAFLPTHARMHMHGPARPARPPPLVVLAMLLVVAARTRSPMHGLARARMQANTRVPAHAHMRPYANTRRGGARPARPAPPPLLPHPRPHRASDVGHGAHVHRISGC
jgi:hypothetical protein